MKLSFKLYQKWYHFFLLLCLTILWTKSSSSVFTQPHLFSHWFHSQRFIRYYKHKTHLIGYRSNLISNPCPLQTAFKLLMKINLKIWNIWFMILYLLIRQYSLGIHFLWVPVPLLLKQWFLANQFWSKFRHLTKLATKIEFYW